MPEASTNPLFKLENGMPTYVDRIGRVMQYDAETQLIRGTLSFSHDRLRALDPSYTGYTHIFVTRMPFYMEQIARGQVIDKYDDDAIAIARTHLLNLKTIIEMGSTSYSGTPDLSMNTSDVNLTNSVSYPVPLGSSFDGKQFTIRCLETRGEPLRHAIEYHISCITDPNRHITELGGALNKEGTGPLEPTIDNFTMSLMVVQTDQTMRNIQDISIWNSVLLPNIDRSNLDWNGDIDIVAPRDIQMMGVYLPDPHNAEVDKIAKTLLGKRLAYYKRFSEMNSKEIGSDRWLDTDYSFS